MRPQQLLPRAVLSLCSQHLEECFLAAPAMAQASTGVVCDSAPGGTSSEQRWCTCGAVSANVRMREPWGCGGFHLDFKGCIKQKLVTVI